MLMSPDAFERYLRADIVKWARVIDVAGIKAD
jgi:tripartite-type tricarboxylate transporter receptor subunit TctC